MKKKVVVTIMICFVLAIVTLISLINSSDQSELSCRLIGGKIVPYKIGCVDCFSGCDSKLKEFYDYIRRGFRPAYLG